MIKKFKDGKTYAFSRKRAERYWKDNEFARSNRCWTNMANGCLVDVISEYTGKCHSKGLCVFPTWCVEVKQK